MACHGCFLSCHGENHPDSKSGWAGDPDKPGCIMSCQGDEMDAAFLQAFFLDLRPLLLTFATNHSPVNIRNVFKWFKRL